MATFAVTIDALGVEQVAASLSKFDAATLGSAALLAVNGVAERAYSQSLELMTAGINLTDDYVRSRMQLTLGTNPAKAEASITAQRQGLRGTTLTTYGAQIRMVPVKHPLRAKGDAKRGIPKGMKAAGFTAEVTRSSVKAFPNAFVIPVGGRLLTVSKPAGGGHYRTMYGPSVWQLFRHTVPGIEREIAQDLRDSVTVEVNKKLEELL